MGFLERLIRAMPKSGICRDASGAAMGRINSIPRVERVLWMPWIRQAIVRSKSERRNSAMPQAKRTLKLKRPSKVASVIGIAGASLAASASGSVAEIPPVNMAPFQVLNFGEEEISDVSLATFHLFDKEQLGAQSAQSRVQLARGGCGCHGGGCGGRGCGGRGCGGGFRGCGGCGHGGCRGCGRGCGFGGCGGCGCGGGWGWGGCCLSWGGCFVC
jgi:hypothetical protein